MAPPGQPQKTMSSRLSSMKFMQRAEASQKRPNESPSEASNKRTKLVNDSPSEQLSINPVEIEELKEKSAERTQYVERKAEEAGDTKWSLEIDNRKPHASPVYAVSSSYGPIDHQIREDSGFQPALLHDSDVVLGRKSYGEVKRSTHAEHTTNGTKAENEEDDSADSGQIMSESESDSKRQKKRKDLLTFDEKAKSIPDRVSAKQKIKVEASDKVNLRKLTSISGGGGSGKSSTKCYACGQQGHKKQDCPKQKRRK